MLFCGPLLNYIWETCGEGENPIVFLIRDLKRAGITQIACRATTCLVNPPPDSKPGEILYKYKPLKV